MEIEIMRIEKTSSEISKKTKGPNYCGGFKPPKGHLDTQLFPECKGYPTDRDIVKKTTDKRNKNKKASILSNKIDKYAKLGAYLEGKHSPWDQWKNSPKLFEDNNVFITNIKALLEHGGNQFLPSSPDYSPMRKMIFKAINLAFTGKSEESYLDAANKINVALNYAEPIMAKNNIKIEKTAKNKKKKEELNPWAICTESIAKTEGTTERSKWSDDAKERYERCILKVKKQDKDKNKKETKSFNLKNLLKKSATLLPDNVEYYEDSGSNKIPKIPGYYPFKEYQKWGWCPTYRNEENKEDILYYDRDTRQLLNWLEMKDLLRATWRPASREDQDWWVVNIGEKSR